MSGWYTSYWNAFLLHVSVILFTRGGGLPHCKLGYTPSPGTRGRHPPTQCMLGDAGNKRAVRILLECNLTLICISLHWWII